MSGAATGQPNRPYGCAFSFAHARRVVCGSRLVKDNYGPGGPPKYPHVALVYGSRDWTDPEPIRAYLGTLPPGTLVVHGGARGADALAGDLARLRGLPVHIYVADWGTHGRAAGPLRNQQMLDSEDITQACGFRLPGKSHGTDDMSGRLVKAGTPHKVVAPCGHPWPASGAGVCSVQAAEGGTCHGTGVQP